MQIYTNLNLATGKNVCGVRIQGFSLNIHSCTHHNVCFLKEDNVSPLLNFAFLGLSTMPGT